MKKQKQEILEQLNYLFESETFYFSHKDISDEHDNGVNTKTVALPTPISPMATPKIDTANSLQMVPIAPRFMNQEVPKLNSVQKLELEENSKNSNGMKLKEYLERYVTVSSNFYCPLARRTC